MTTDTAIVTEERVRALAKEVLDASAKGKDIPSKQEMYDLLKALPAETERKFETTVVGYSLKWDDSVIKGTLVELIQMAEEYPDPTSEQNQVAFAAYCVAVNYERRMRNNSEEGRWLQEYRSLFEKEHVFYTHMYLLVLMEKIENFKEYEWDEAGVRELLEIANKNSINLTGNIGGPHAFAETVALTFENVPAIMQTIQSTDKVNWLNRGIVAIEESIKQDPDYAKFYCTHARLLAVSGDYDRALSKLNEAIDKEDNGRSDYAIRIGRYLTYIQQFRAHKQMASMENNAAENLEQYRKALEEQEKQTIVKNMEFLGLFSGIVSFTIGSLTITGAIAQQSIKSAAGLIVVLMGALMGVFASFGIILHGIASKKALRNIFVLLLGIAAVVGGILFCLS